MRIALKEASKAYERGEVPIGALVVDEQGQIVSKAYNETITRNDPTAHAEMLALRQAPQILNNFRLLNCTLYVTIEPCIMCAGAIVHARICEVVFGAFDGKWGALDSLYKIGEDERLNHRFSVVSGVLEADCANLMQQFFRERRKSGDDEEGDPPLYVIDDEMLED
jgi:tRNA(adenine34) deaminase